MRIIVARDYDEVSYKGANLIAAQIMLKPNSVMGFATGSTPEGTYQELIRRYEKGDISFKDVVSFNLDEYVGLEKDDPQSYHHYMMHNLHNFTDINKQNIYLPDGKAADLLKECKEYDSKIESYGGIDYQLLGIGTNGHIGFNEPAETISNDTMVISLAQSTIDANKRFFEKEEDVPRQALTMGVGTIFRARKVLMLVTGEGKAEILEKVLFGDITPQVPASLLRMHPDFTIIADEAAAALVKNRI